MNEGEVIVFDHLPSHRTFRRAAVFLLLVSLVPTLIFALVFPDTLWIMLPLFLACMLLVQERFKLGRHRAWITNRRIILQDGTAIDLADVVETKARSVVVGVRHGADRAMLPLYYAADGETLAAAIDTARGASDDTD
nr:hypothetical protein [Octadecabacter dasysiphoniae]